MAKPPLISTEKCQLRSVAVYFFECSNLIKFFKFVNFITFATKLIDTATSTKQTENQFFKRASTYSNL
ncbi:hypothetical protein L596_006230 [Steinernema carpocapsae]|uniref:Uncharacterized protein n=1 Tax=Steinernema carpocapsae TaxID=34508 RepID=A0A4U8V364_STECR|nr:hypothetical protein L596_006230 [Steinernema carpocapsae]